MNKHQVNGRIEQSTGKLKELAGKVVGNESLEAEGLAEQAKGKLQASYGDTKEKTKDTVKKAIDKL